MYGRSNRTEHPEPVGHGAAGDVGGVGVGLELVRNARAEMELNGDAGVAKALGVGEVFVTEDVELAHLEVARGQAREIDGASRCGVLRNTAARICQLAQPGHR